LLKLSCAGRRAWITLLAIASLFATTGVAHADNAFVDDFPLLSGVQNEVVVLGTPGQTVVVDAPRFNLDFADTRHLAPSGTFQTTLNPGGSPYVAYDPQTWTIPGTSSWTTGSRFVFRPKLKVTMPLTLGRTDQFVSFTAATDTCSAGLGDCITGNPLTVKVHMETKPRPVSDEKATGDNTGIDLTWTHSPDQSQITSYHIDRFDMATGTGTPITLGPDKSSYRDSAAVAGHQYCYRITAIWEGAGGAFNGSDPGKLVCAYVNRAPGAPGAPAADPTLTRGSTTVSWGPAADPDGDNVTYELQHAHTNANDWFTIGQDFTATSRPVVEQGGTWHYRVRATDDLGNVGPWSQIGSDHKADTTGPTVDDVTYDKEPIGGWFKDSVTVTFAWADPLLPDGSAGSGIASHSDPPPFTTSGTHDATGTATDVAGNESTATREVKVDATRPTAQTVGCPRSLTVGEPGATATWTASDGESGLSSAPSGTFEFDTSAPGKGTLPGPAPEDNVGHTGDAPSCAYTVAYEFAGFLAPINGSAVNVGKTGRTYPIKWRLHRDDGTLISDAEAQALVPAMVAGQKQSECNFALAEDTLLEEATSGGTELRYDATADQFIYNYKAPSTVGCYVLGIRNADGANTKQVNFNFTR